MVRKSPDLFLKEFNNLYNGELELVTSYKRLTEKVVVKHPACGFEWSVLPVNIMNGRKCPNCNPASRAAFLKSHSTFHEKTTAEFSKEVDELTGGNISLAGEYVGSGLETLFHCNVHNIDFSMSPTSFRVVNYRCPKCKYEHNSETQKKSGSQFVKELQDAHNGEIIALDPYAGNHTIIRFKCRVCGCVFSTEPNAVLRISGCPSCAEPKGEAEIEKFLKNKHLDYTRQKTFDGVSIRRKLRYDFYVPSMNLLIEYDGKQHYESIPYFGGEETLARQKRHDSVKDRYAIENDIRLIRLTYKVAYKDVSTVIESYLHGVVCEGMTVVN